MYDVNSDFLELQVQISIISYGYICNNRNHINTFLINTFPCPFSQKNSIHGIMIFGKQRYFYKEIPVSRFVCDRILTKRTGLSLILRVKKQNIQRMTAY